MVGLRPKALSSASLGLSSSNTKSISSPRRTSSPQNQPLLHNQRRHHHLRSKLEPSPPHGRPGAPLAMLPTLEVLPPRHSPSHARAIPGSGARRCSSETIVGVDDDLAISVLLHFFNLHKRALIASRTTAFAQATVVGFTIVARQHSSDAMPATIVPIPSQF